MQRDHASTEQSRREMRPPRACTEKVSYCEDSGDEEIVKAKRESLRAYSYQKGEKTVQKKRRSTSEVSTFHSTLGLFCPNFCT
jgi:tRNA splicing ligase